MFPWPRVTWPRVPRGMHGVVSFRFSVEGMSRHNRAFKWFSIFAIGLIAISVLSQVPDVRLRRAGASHRHFKSGEWVIVDESSHMSDSGFARLADEIVHNGTYDVLSLSGTSITDAGFAPVSKLTTLDWIQMSDCKFSDEALRHLYRLSRLHTIRIHDCSNISKVGIAELQAALPKCQVTCDDG